ncbi:MAG: RHS repeat-associated core domain-containing protein, partial [Acidobacteria bacterium]|nr:RHS repeat-associated core domain-containing protein [Acidobacteriota bacterium]
DLDYDALNMEVRFAKASPAEEYLYAYGPGNNRIISFDVNSGTFYWSLRDLDGKILREHRVTGGGYYQGPTQPGEIWTFEKDHVHGPTGLLATRDAAGVRQFFHQDHLGTPRAISSATGTLAGTRDYYPYGVPTGGSGADERTSKFAGHELDRHTATYYMLSRTYAYPWMRFASVDPGRSGWNYYSYAESNPLNRVDPDGEAAQVLVGAAVGGLVGGAIDLALQLYEGEGVDGRQLLGAVVSGGIVGGTAALTGGASLLVQGSVIVDVGGVALASVAGGVAGRAIAGDSKEEIFDGTAILTDLTLGGAARGAARFASGKVENVVRNSPGQKARLGRADSRARAAGGKKPRSASRREAAERNLKSVQGRPERVGGRAGDVTENAVTVFFRDSFTAISNFFTGD